MDIKNLGSRQIRWAQNFFWYHFRIDYRQGKANAAADPLSRCSQRSQSKEEKLLNKNTQTLHWLQPSMTNASLAGLNLSAYSSGSQVEATHLLPLYQLFICNTYVLRRLCQF